MKKFLTLVLCAAMVLTLVACGSKSGGGNKEVDVKIGESNDRFVQILDGLKEDDVIYLYRPHQGRTETK